MARDLVKGAGVGLLVGPVLGYPVSLLYAAREQDIEGYTVAPYVLLAVLLVIPGGWLLARLVRISHPVRSALLAPLLLLVLKNVAVLAVPSPRPLFAFLGVIVLAVVSYAGAAQLTCTVSLVPRVIAAGVVCACVAASAMVQQQRAEAEEQQWRRDYVAFLTESVPLAVPDVVPQRTLVNVWTIADTVLALHYAKNHESEPDVFVRISEDEDPRKWCAAWVRDEPEPCERLADDRWLADSNGRMVLFARLGRRLVEIDSTTLSLDETLTAGRKLRTVSAEYLVDVASGEE